MSPGEHHFAPGSEQEFRCVNNSRPPTMLHHPDSGVSLDHLHPRGWRPDVATGRVMSRDWLAVYTSALGKTKYRRLSIPGRAALLHVWMLAGAQSPEATFDRRELVDVLALDGWESATVVIEELVDRGWLEVDALDRLLVHDWDDHQLAATEAARRAYERDRKAAWRRPRRPDPLPPAPPSLDSTGASQHRTVQRPDLSPNVRDKSGTPATATHLANDDTTCPGCGDELHPADDNVVAGPGGQLRHVVCPTGAPSLRAVS